MKRKYIVISMALLSAVSTWAQEITGTVTDALGSPVAGAKVHLVNTPNVSAITDRNGVFVLNGEEGDWMVVSYADWQANQGYRKIYSDKTRSTGQNSQYGNGKPYRRPANASYIYCHCRRTRKKRNSQFF